MTQDDEDPYKSNIICSYCVKKFEIHKNRDHCHLTGKYRGPAHSNSSINVTQKQSKFIPCVYHNFKNYDSHLFFQKLVDKRK